MVDLFATCTFIALLGPMQWSTIVEVKISVDIVFFINKMVNLNLIITLIFHLTVVNFRCGKLYQAGKLAHVIVATGRVFVASR